MNAVCYPLAVGLKDFLQVDHLEIAIMCFFFFMSLITSAHAFAQYPLQHLCALDLVLGGILDTLDDRGGILLHPSCTHSTVVLTYHALSVRHN